MTCKQPAIRLQTICNNYPAIKSGSSLCNYIFIPSFRPLWVTDSIRIAHWSGMPNSLLNILPHHFHLKLSLLQEVFSIKNRFLTDWISFYGHSTTICIKGEILSSFIQDKISPLIFSWKVSLNIFSFKNRFRIDWISFYGHRTTICIKGEILSLCSNRLIQYFWPRVWHHPSNMVYFGWSLYPTSSVAYVG